MIATATTIYGNRLRRADATRAGNRIRGLKTLSRTGARAWMSTRARMPSGIRARRRGLAADHIKYLQPEPLLQEPIFVLGRSRSGIAAPTYAYASNNPIAFTDEDGLHDNNGCKNSPSCSACDAQADKITDRTLRLCVRLQCKAQDLKLRCDAEAKKGCATLADQKKGSGFRKGKGGSAVVGEPDNPTKEISWCELPLSSECQEKALVHEIAHTCGWTHNEGKGVPGNDGSLPGCGRVR